MKSKQWRRGAALFLAAALLLSGCAGKGAERAAAFLEKAEALRAAVLADWVKEELKENPAGAVGNVVFLSVCGGTERARVYSGTGAAPEDAWDAAVAAAEQGLKKDGPDPLWVKADLVYLSELAQADWLSHIGEAFGSGGFRYGLALDPNYETALLEAELNSAGIYDYENGGVNLERLNAYLEETGRKPVESLPEEYIAFQCAGWFCDEEGKVCQLSLDETDYGRRSMPSVTQETAWALVLDGAEYLASQVREDGSLGEDQDRACQAEVLSALIRGYQVQPGQDLAEAIDRAASGLLASMAYAEDSDLAFLPQDGEITLENNALALIALADCMEASGETAYLPACQGLGAGILSLLDTDAGTFTHVLDAETLTRKEAFRSADWDGMGITALSRLYGLTEDPLWLWAAELAMDHIIAEDYTQHESPWTSYAVDALTKYEQERAEYFSFGLKNAQRSLPGIYRAETTCPEGLELLMASYESRRQMLEAGFSADGFALETVVETISARTQRQLDGYIFPEYAMYLENPEQSLGAFLTREEGLRIDPAQVCRNIYGYAMYADNYDALKEDGLPE